MLITGAASRFRISKAACCAAFADELTPERNAAFTG